MLSAKDFLAAQPLPDSQHRAEQTILQRLQRLDKYKQADLDAGRLVRIRIEHPSELPTVGLYPTRVAAFVCKVLGQASRKGVRVALSTQGSTNSALYPAKQVDLAVLALLSHARSTVKKECRRAGRPMLTKREARDLGSRTEKP